MLTVFLQTVRKAAQIKAGLEVNPFEDADLRNLQWSQQYLQLGIGLVETRPGKS
jgi:hypothetical protein